MTGFKMSPRLMRRYRSTHLSLPTSSSLLTLYLSRALASGTHLSDIYDYNCRKVFPSPASLFALPDRESSSKVGPIHCSNSSDSMSSLYSSMEDNVHLKFSQNSNQSSSKHDFYKSVSNLLICSLFNVSFFVSLTAKFFSSIFSHRCKQKLDKRTNIPAKHARDHLPMQLTQQSMLILLKLEEGSKRATIVVGVQIALFYFVMFLAVLIWNIFFA